jgi:4'-phosphopantetheinyl transferase
MSATALRPDPGAALALAGAGGVALWTCDLDAGDAMGLAADRALLAPSERARADRFHFARDRDRYTRGRAFLRRRLAEATGRPAAALRLREAAWGKPALDGPGPEFNLSHSGPLAVLAISEAGPVGIDVERTARLGDLDRLAESCFLPEERKVLDGLGEAARRRRFFAFWTAKEALMKLTGQGMSLPPLAIALRLEDGWPAGCARPGGLSGARLDYPDLGREDAICCLARPAPEAGR